VNSKLQIPSVYDVVTLDTVDTVLEEAIRRAKCGADEGTLIWARNQTGTRWRGDSGWLPGSGNLHCAIILRPDFPTAISPELNFVAAVSLGSAIAARLSPGVSLRYRWPNDIILNADKVAGVMLAMSSQHDAHYEWVVLAAHVNIATYPQDQHINAVSIIDAEGLADIDPSNLLEDYAKHFLASINKWAETGLASILKSWQQRVDGIGERISINLNEDRIAGILESLGADGSANIVTDDGSSRQIRVGEYYNLADDVETRSAIPGIYCEIDAVSQLVHEFQYGEYELADINEYFQLGNLESGEHTQLTLTRHELQQLKFLMDAYSFDYDEGFIAMCGQMVQCVEDTELSQICFSAVD
jgi:BirA family biotin operon repressor/biotin-[acetyl-CoA-carboxylase] ligase